MSTDTSHAWVSVEGINGAGKTHLATRARDLLGDQCVSLVELSDTDPAGLPGQVIAALHRHGDAFLRTGSPRAETLLLLGLQVHRHERIAPLAQGQVILEDRGLLSVAAYQAAIIEPHDGIAALATARTILETAAPWRPPAHVTVLLRDDLEICLRRFANRIGRVVQPDERALIKRVQGLYDELAGETVRQLCVIDRRTTSETDAIHRIAQVCRQALRANTARSRL